MTSDAGKQQTRIGEIKGIIEDIHSRSLDIRSKAYELCTPQPPEKPKADVEEATDTVANELGSSLRAIRSILREAYETLTAFN